MIEHILIGLLIIWVAYHEWTLRQSLSFIKFLMQREMQRPQVESPIKRKGE